MPREALRLGALHHAGMVVPDWERAARHLAGGLGLGAVHPFDGRYATRVGGTPLDLVVAGAFVRLGDVLLELLQPLDDRSPLAAWLAANPGGGLHHLAYAVPSLAPARALVADGTLGMLVDGAGAGDASKWVYLEDPGGELVLELVERGPGSDAFFGAVARGLGAGSG
jgi:methylmalonyl-CoA/ethylmalonyl-CoA epimerase